MIFMKLSSLLFAGEYSSRNDPQEIEIESIAISGDDIRPGCLFICLRGFHYDAHNLLRTAKERGAAAAIVEAGTEAPIPKGLPVFAVTSSRRAMAFAYSRFYNSPADGMKLIAVTGTNGKTSTVFMLYHLLAANGFRVGMIGTVACLSVVRNYRDLCRKGGRATMTTPDPDILYAVLHEMKKDGIEYVVMEASSHALALDKLAPLSFEIGIFTNLSSEHLDFHKTMRAYLAAKASLFSACRRAIVNFDSDAATELSEWIPCPILRCGAVYHEEYNAEEIRLLGASGVSYLYASPTLRMPVFLPIPGSFTVYNSLLALTAALALGVPPREASRTLRELSGVPGRMERVPLPGASFSVFIDYAHTEAALENLLTTVNSFRREGERIVLVFGCGGDRDTSKRAPMGKVAEAYADRVIVTSDNARSEEPNKIIRDILLGMRKREKRAVIVNRRRAIRHAILCAQEGDIILLVGKGHETYELTSEGARPFDERALVFEAFAERQIGEEHNTGVYPRK